MENDFDMPLSGVVDKENNVNTLQMLQVVRFFQRHYKRMTYSSKNPELKSRGDYHNFITSKEERVFKTL